MKIGTLLLAFFVFAMTIIPCNWDDIVEHADHSTCLQEQEHQHSTPHSDCPDGHCCCSPFSSCNGCSAFDYSERTICTPGRQMAESKMFTPFIDRYFFDSFANIWQPPKIIVA